MEGKNLRESAVDVNRIIGHHLRINEYVLLVFEIRHMNSKRIPPNGGICFALSAIGILDKVFASVSTAAVRRA